MLFLFTFIYEAAFSFIVYFKKYMIAEPLYKIYIFKFDLLLAVATKIYVCNLHTDERGVCTFLEL